jgi:hypothetical protein
VKCKICGSYAINHHCHGRDGSDPDLCDVCYWRKRAEQLELEYSTANGRCVNCTNDILDKLNEIRGIVS